ncbi:MULTISPECIES: hypothetical protein [Mycolicibacterium]|jgi:hypothetical protein|uniref:hypothetical protein n=1 Tax=Mycolicibacterium TaxID=1866885 RepID=UPI0023BA5CF0|nr:MULTISPECIES: hypothetical protein [Mycolicibacterium]MDW5609381.1 hypothetical protein [Mycolicibacterium sp. D5.8-2]
MDASSPQRRRAVAAALIAFWTVVVGAEWALPGIESAHAHGPHPLAASAMGAHSVVTDDHPHVSKGESPLAPDTLVEAVLPRGTVSLIALGLTAALAVIPLVWHQAALAAIRGPPRRSSTTLTGRDLLARLCIARC